MDLRSLISPWYDVGVRVRPISTVFAGLLLASCAVGPDYVRPAAPVTPSFKYAKGWTRAQPLDLLDRGDWWSVYRDSELAGYLSQVNFSNQTVIAAEAAYREARSIIREAQAGYFPTVTAGYSVTGAHQGSGLTMGTATTTLTFNPVTNASWDLDVWGKIRRMVESDAAAAQVNAADLQNAKLSARAELATAYFELRATDSLKTLLDRTVVEYRKTLEITRNQYKAGVVSEADVVTAETQLLTTQAQAINTGVLRAQYANAIAVLIGKPPAAVSVPVANLTNSIPKVPVTVPSVVLQRRPDIAAAERMLQQENALIGVAVANFYPDISLSGMFGFVGGTPLPISAANEAWTLIGTATQTVFDGGLRSSELAAARASYQQYVAMYRQTVLTAFQQVEDNLAALRVLIRELKVQEEAVKEARKAVTVYLNQYQAGTVAFTTVVTAEATLLSDEEAALTTREDIFVASVALVEALGGGWDAALLPPLPELTKVPTFTPPL